MPLRSFRQHKRLRARDKIKVFGLAPTWQAVNELKDKGVKAQTFASFLTEVKQQDFDKEKYSKALFICDEASMLSNSDQKQFMETMNEVDARATDVGDIEQLQGQGEGKPFELSIRRGVIPHVKLTDIVRQRDAPILKSAVENILDKDIKGTIAKIQAQPIFKDHQDQEPALVNKIRKELPSADEKGSQHLAGKTGAPKAKQPKPHRRQVNIIETKGNYSKDRKLNTEMSKQIVLQEGAVEYLSRTPQSREQTIFIAYSNKDRDTFSEMVRDGLGLDPKDKQDVCKVTRLRSLDHTRPEMRTMEAYTKEQATILSIGRDYYKITGVNEKNKLVNLEHTITNKKSTLNPSKHDHKMTQVWSVTEKNLAPDDRVVLRKADKNRGHIANIDYKVSSVDKDNKLITLRNDQGELKLNTKEMRDCHWDYAYAKTSDMSQGATEKYVVPMVKATDALTDIRRAVVDLSRATTHAKLITDDLNQLTLRLEGKTLQSVSRNHGDKRSAMDTLDQYLPDKISYFGTSRILQGEKKRQGRVWGKTISNEQTNSQQFQARKWHEQKINSAFLTGQQGYYDLFGVPEKITNDKIIWQDYEVDRTGNNAGQWISTQEPSEKGYQHATKAVQLLKKTEENQAGYLACQMAELSVHSTSVAVKKPKWEEQNQTRIESAKSIHQGTKEISGTLGEKYLHQTRGISKETIARSSITYWDKNTPWKNTDENEQLVNAVNKTPAIVLPAIDQSGELTGVQRVYLDGYKPIKNTFMEVAKLSKGVIAGSPAVVQKGDDGRVFVAEGPETALSIAEVEPNATVLCSFSVNNLSKMDEVLQNHNPQEVILAGDNDGVNSNAVQKTEAAKDALIETTGLNVTTMYPDPLTGQDKTDYNDILLNQGRDALKEMINRDLTMEHQINDALVDKCIDLLVKGEKLEDTQKLMDVVEHIKDELKVNSQGYGGLIEALSNEKYDFSKVIDEVSSIKINDVKAQEPVWQGEKLENIEMQI